MSRPEPGPLADEAARLIGAAQDWLHRTVGDPASARIANGSPECCWCPFCQLIATLRGERPELTERLADTQAALAGLLRTLADAAAATVPTGTAAGGPARVRKIRLDDEADDEERAGADAAGEPEDPAGGGPVA